MSKSFTRRESVGRVNDKGTMRTVYAGTRKSGPVVEVFLSRVEGEFKTVFWYCDLIEEAAERGRAKHGPTSAVFKNGRDDEPGVYTLILQPRNSGCVTVTMDEETMETARCRAHLMFEEIRADVEEAKREERLPAVVAPKDRIAVSSQKVDDLKAKFAAKFGKEPKARKDDAEREERVRNRAQKKAHEPRTEKKPCLPKTHERNCDMCLLDQDGMWRDVFFQDGRFGPALVIFDFENQGSRNMVVVPIRRLGQVFSRGRLTSDHVVLTYRTRKGCKDKGNVEIKAKPLVVGNETLTNGFTLMPIDEEFLDSIVGSCKATIKAEANRAKANSMDKQEAKAMEKPQPKSEQGVKKAAARQKMIDEQRQGRKAKKRSQHKAKASKPETKQPSRTPRKEKSSRPPKDRSNSSSRRTSVRTEPPAPIFHRHNMTYEERLADQREEGRRMAGLN